MLIFVASFNNIDKRMTIRKSNARPGDGHPKTKDKSQPTGQRIGKSKPVKANNQLNRRVK